MSAVRAPSLTAARAAQQRYAAVRFGLDNATRIASVAGRLRAHARRCRVEKGYKVLAFTNRSTCQDAIAGMASRLTERAQLRLSLGWWLEQAEALLATLDELNGGKS